MSRRGASDSGTETREDLVEPEVAPPAPPTEEATEPVPAAPEAEGDEAVAPDAVIGGEPAALDEDDADLEAVLDDATEGSTDAEGASDDERAALPTPLRRQLPESMSTLNVYLARLKDVEILPIEEQNQLAETYQQTGDREAAARLVASNLRLVVKIAFQFRRQWADIMDLIAEGNLGLSEAIRKFDADRGVPFPSYARFWIRARILAFIQENKHLIHAGSRAARKLFWRLDRERRKLYQEGREPTQKLLADRVGVDEEDIGELAPILDQRPVSLDVPVGGDEDEGRPRGEVMEDARIADPESMASGEETQELLREVFQRFRETLDDRDKTIWDRRLQAEEPIRLEDLGQEFGVSKERVRQLEVRIKRSLKKFLEEELGDQVIVEALH